MENTSINSGQPPIPSTLTYADLPAGLDLDLRDLQRAAGNFTFYSRELIDSLVEHLTGKRVLEVFAGRGQMTALLRDQGIEVVATSIQNCHDRSEDLGYCVEVEQLGVGEAVQAYADWLDVILVGWPTTCPSLARAVRHIPARAEVVFIGEVTDWNCNPPFLGGCATDEFFAAVEEVPGHQLRYPTYGCDTIKVYRRS